jgi:rhamnosyltransferase
VVSAIIPTFNAGQGIGALISALRSQTIPLEIIVIDSSSTDNTAGAAMSFGARVLTVKKQDFNHGKTRNIAARAAGGEVLVFLTQDALPFDDRAVEYLLRPLREPKVAACYGRHIPREDARPTEKFARYFNYPDKSVVKGAEHVTELGIRAFFFSNVFSAVRRHEFFEVGSFPEDLIMFEDMILAGKLIRKGYCVAYSPQAEILHSHCYSLGQQFKRYLEAGISFSNHPGLAQTADADREGLAFLREELKFLARERKIHWIGYAVLDAAVKYAGYKAGLNSSKLPKLLRGKVLGPHV